MTTIIMFPYHNCYFRFYASIVQTAKIFGRPNLVQPFPEEDIPSRTVTLVFYIKIMKNCQIPTVMCYVKCKFYV